MVSDGLHLGPPADAAHPYLADPAMALIAEFHTGPGNGIRAAATDLAGAPDSDLADTSEAGVTGGGATNHSDSGGARTDGSQTSVDGTYASRLGADPDASAGSRTGPGSRPRSARRHRAAAPAHEGWAASTAGSPRDPGSPRAGHRPPVLAPSRHPRRPRSACPCASAWSSA